MTAAEERAEIMERLTRIEGKVDKINGTVKDHEDRLEDTEDYVKRLDKNFSDIKRLGYYVVAVVLGSIGAEIPGWIQNAGG